MSKVSASNMGPIDPDVLDLMIQHATCGLSEEQQQKLESLGLTDEQGRIELTAAAFDLALMQQEPSAPDNDLPASLRQQITQSAGAFFDGQSEAGSHNGKPKVIDQAIQPETKSDDAPTVTRGSASRPKDMVTRREIISMSIAAASLLLVFTGLNPLAYNPNAETERTAAQEFAAFMKDKPSDTHELDWIDVNKSGIEGQVVWSDDAQRGFMVFNGLEPNDPKIEQYQLWIFDTDPGQEVPVDGGVFDVARAKKNPQTGEVIVPFRPHVPVEKGVQFAVTIETPGGVMKSDRKRLPLLASLK